MSRPTPHRIATPWSRSLALLALLALLATRLGAQAAPDTDWRHYGNDPGGARHSALVQVHRGNVGGLVEAWRFSTGEAKVDYQGRRRSFEATPLVVGGVMYLATPLGKVFALDAATGRERWRWDARIDPTIRFGDFTSRGVSYWEDPEAPPGAACRARIVLATVDARLVALDARDGRPCRAFGAGGTVDLRRGLRNAPFEHAEYEVTSPPAVVGGMLVVGSAVADNNRIDAASGEVRGYDARTGALRWAFDPVPQDSADPAWHTWRGADAHRTGAANAWSVIAADTARGLVFVPTSAPSPDYYGGARLGDNRYANSVVALRARTGAVAWHFQTVHHDLWDYDNAAPPALVRVRRDGREVDAVLQATKTGMLFVLDRETGRPVVPVEERAVPASTVPGEVASPTQPFSALPALSPHAFDTTTAAILGSDADRAACRAAFAGLRNDGIFTPPSLEGTIAMPSNIGGAHWGGVAFEPTRQLAIVPVNRLVAVVQLMHRDSVGDRREPGWEYARMRGTPYMMRRRFLLTPTRVPCSPPPYGALVAVDVERGRIAWEVPLGTPGPLAPTREAASSGAGGGAAASGRVSPFAARGPAAADPATLAALGSPNLGGAITTAGGLVFVAATLDARLRAFDVETGRELWSGALPAGAKATPMTYAVGGRQYVAIAAGGDGEVWGKGDEVVVFALPAAAPRR